MANNFLTNAKKAKNDEFYTQYGDIQKEIEAYLEYNPDVFRGKVIYCNCDDPFESNFFKYFANKFKDYGLKKLITTSYTGSPIAQTKLQLKWPDEPVDKKKLPDRKNRKAFKIEINEVSDLTKDNITNLDDVMWLLQHDKNTSSPLSGDGKFAAGDFRSKECIDLLEQSDIVITNPPFSLFREYVKQLFDYNKKFLIIGNINCITYKEIFKKIKSNETWLGNGMGRWISGFIVPESYDLYGTEARLDENGDRIVATNNCLWLTNLDHGRRHQPLPLMTMDENLRYSKHKEIKGKNAYEKYDNYDAIEVPFTDAIPSDYDGVMGVPISFLDKYNPEQFEIIGCSYDYGRPDGWNKNINMSGTINGVSVYKRILIKHKEKIG